MNLKQMAICSLLGLFFPFSTGLTAQTAIPGQIEAENYTAMSGIQTEACTEGGTNVGYIEAGDWMDYSVSITAGTYTVSYRVASLSTGGGLSLQIGGATYNTVSFGSTGGWQTWTTVTSTVTLPAGNQTIRIYANLTGWNINWFSFSGGAATSTPTRSSTPTPTPTTVSTLTDITNLGGTISAQYTNSSPAGEEIAKLIDNLTSTKYLTANATAWVQYQVGTGYVVTKYTLTSANDAAERDPLSWTFQGSNNGSTWTQLDSRSGEDFATRFLARSFSFSNTTSFTYFRLNMTNNSGTMLQLAEWDIFGVPGSGTSTATSTTTATQTKTPAATVTKAPTVTPTKTSTPTPTAGPTAVANLLFDDFTYTGPTDTNLSNFRWTVRSGTGGPGPSGCTWSQNNISFITDTALAGNKFMRLTSSTSGTGATTSQAEIYHQTKFLQGTYATRIRFTDAPISGADGDQIVETFFAISPYAYCNDPNYCEIDFEYLANGGWGPTSATLWETTWETYCADPWSKDNVYNSQTTSYAGWHTLVFTVSGGVVSYYVDGALTASHSGTYYPEQLMSINFNLWFIAEGLSAGTASRTYVQDVDWIYHAKNTVLTPAQVQTQVDSLRAQAVARRDTM